jgi:hypothetical protein
MKPREKGAVSRDSQFFALDFRHFPDGLRNYLRTRFRREAAGCCGLARKKTGCIFVSIRSVFWRRQDATGPAAAEMEF